MNNSIEPHMDGTREKMLDMIRDICGKKARIEDSLLLLGIDSIAMAELTIEIEKRFGIRVNEEIFEIETLAELADYIDTRRQGTLAN